MAARTARRHEIMAFPPGFLGLSEFRTESCSQRAAWWIRPVLKVEAAQGKQVLWNGLDIRRLWEEVVARQQSTHSAFPVEAPLESVGNAPEVFPTKQEKSLISSHRGEAESSGCAWDPRYFLYKWRRGSGVQLAEAKISFGSLGSQM